MTVVSKRTLLRDTNLLLEVAKTYKDGNAEALLMRVKHSLECVPEDLVCAKFENPSTPNEVPDVLTSLPSTNLGDRVARATVAKGEELFQETVVCSSESFL